MLRFIWSHIRRRAGRSIALLLGVLVATTGFTLLTGSTETTRLQVTGMLDASARPAYDILVRPKGGRSLLENERNLLRPNHSSGLFGGITRAQLEQIKHLPGVDVAAPLAMMGYTMVTIPVSFDVTDAVDRTARQQVIRLDPTLLADRGMTRWADAPSYVYVTRNRLVIPNPQLGGQVPNRLCGNGLPGGRPYEVLPDGRRSIVCDTAELELPVSGGSQPLNGLTAAQRTSLRVVQMTPAGAFRSASYGVLSESASMGVLSEPRDRLIVSLPVTVPLLLAAIDPRAEAALTGIDRAITAGRYLAPDDRTEDRTLPVLGTAKPYLDQQFAVRYSRVSGSGVAGSHTQDLREHLRSRPRTLVGSAQQDVAEAYLRAMSRARSDRRGSVGQVFLMVRAGDPTYVVRPDGALGVAVREPDLDVYRKRDYVGLRMPGLALDAGFRPLTQWAVPPSDQGPRALKPVGLYDPEKLAGFSELSRVPLETYQAPTATGADAETRRLLADRPLLPNGNPGGYLATPPFLLMDLTHYPELDEPADPISVIRVRVDEIRGYDSVSAERVRRTAEQIALITGLDVDITFGSSPTRQTIVLPGGKFERPELRLTELWSRKGVASLIEQAVDRKSLLLFGLILLVCALFLANAVAAAVRDRRSELAILACLGWPARRLGAAILGEIALLGLAGGALALLIGMPLGAALDVRMPLSRALLAIPIGLLLALLAGLLPALRAAGAQPGAALRPAVLPVRRARRRRTILELAMANLGRVPGRTLLGAGSLAIGICSLTVLAAVQWAFHGQVQGTLLGDAVTLTVRGVDVVAAVATAMLGLLATADVLYLNIRDRAAEFATLRATGWSEPAIGRLVVYEGIGLGLLGVVLGAGAGLAGAAWFVGDLHSALIWAAVDTALAGLLVAGFAALVPALWLRRLPTSALLADE
ncbi:FtsX-like permease family protein [Kribbella sp. NPDC003505]|uniref:FtsX-like permease family protein n=1 Tax=Kribbella sp. NPDC003505 TaxID=3154448 RepID=UPI0033B0698F